VLVLSIGVINIQVFHYKSVSVPPIKKSAGREKKQHMNTYHIIHRPYVFNIQRMSSSSLFHKLFIYSLFSCFLQ